MNHTPVPAQPGMFRSSLAPVSAVFLALGALLGLGSILYLADPAYLAAVSEKILISGIRSYSAHRTWLAAHILISLICCVCPGITVWGMTLTLRGDPARGMNLLSNAARQALLLLKICGAAAVAVFVIRFSLYLISIARRQDWLYQLFATVVMEALMVALAVFLFRLLCRFLDDAEGCAASIGYTLSSRKLDSGSVPAFVATGLTILGIAGLVLAVDRLASMTIGYDGFRQFYKFVLSSHPGQWLCGGSLLFGAVGNLLLGSFLRFYKRTSERAVFYATYKK